MADLLGWQNKMVQAVNTLAEVLIRWDAPASRSVIPGARLVQALLSLSHEWP